MDSLDQATRRTRPNRCASGGRESGVNHIEGARCACGPRFLRPETKRTEPLCLAHYTRLDLARGARENRRMQYRVHKSNIPPFLSSDEALRIVRIVSNANGITLDRIAFAELPVVRNSQTGVLGRRATIIENIEIDPSDLEYALCTTEDVILPYNEKDLRLGLESPWTDVNTAPAPNLGANAKPSDQDAHNLADANLIELGPPRVVGVYPLRVDDGGVVRVGKSRVSLDLVVEQYENGVSPEDMVRAYDTLSLADVHEVIAYYLRNRDAVKDYLKRRADEAAALRLRIEAELPRIPASELIARRDAREQAHAATGE
jgi:uncharacterized protein (DUF433 family)